MESVCNDEKMVDKVIVVSLGSRVFFGQGASSKKHCYLSIQQSHTCRPSISVFSESMASDMEMFAPNTTTTIDDFKVEEFTSTQPGILPGFQGQHKGATTVDDIKEAGNGEVVEDGNVVRHDLLVCQPCEEVVAERKTNSSGVGVVGVNGQVAVRMYEYDEEEIDERPYRCPQEGCEYKAKQRGNIKEHLANIHDIGVTWHSCPQEGCEYKAKMRSMIKKHLANIHDIGVTWHTCPKEGCEYKTKQRYLIKQHLADIHDIGVTWHTCPQEGCEYKAKQRSTIKTHLANIHDIGVTWHACPQDGCEYKAKKRSSIKLHLADIHDIGVTWHACPQEGCEYKAKMRSSIKTHLAYIHDIGVTWHTCPQEGCEYKAKQRRQLKRHLAHIHGISP